MNANELRIGNLVKSDESGITTVNANLLLHLTTMKSAVSGFIDPIPLTEEWLVKLGFESMTGSMQLEYGHGTDSWFAIQWVHNKEVIIYQNEGQIKTKIQYVHQLQNLYFALTGEELI